MDQDPNPSRCSVQHRWGSSEDVSSIGQLAELLTELDAEDPEHPDVWITDNVAGYSVSAFAGSRGLVVWEDDEDVRGPLHMTGYSRPMMQNLFELVMRGQVDEIASLPGYGS